MQSSANFQCLKTIHFLFFSGSTLGNFIQINENNWNFVSVGNFKLLKVFFTAVYFRGNFFIYWVIFVDVKISILRGDTGKSDGGRGSLGWLLLKSYKFFFANFFKYGPAVLSVAPTVHISLPNFADTSKKTSFPYFFL